MEYAISVNGLSVAYSNIEAIQNITLNINEGEFVCIIGPNGGGKTTLLNTMLGFLTPTKGNVKIMGKSPKKVYSRISFVPQIAAVDRNFPINVYETVMTAFLKNGLHPFRFFKKQEKEKAFEYLKTVGLLEKQKSKISDLSGGEFQRLLIARALAGEPEIILLDEPTASVDPATSKNIFEILSELNKRGITVVTVTHDLNFAMKFASKLICVKKELIYFGEPELNQEVKNAMFGNFII